ncbi:MAG: hypothetical protein ACTHK0_03800 [Ginsengibacter sp.]
MSEEQSTASSYLPTAKKILKFLGQKPIKSAEVQFFVDILTEKLRERLVAVQSNKLIKLSMIVDPRFAYSEDFLFNFEWDLLEDEFVDFLSREKSNETAVEAEENEAETSEIDHFEDEDSMDIGVFHAMIL